MPVVDYKYKVRSVGLTLSKVDGFGVVGDMEKTTDLNVIRNNPKRFTWGKIAKIHDVGRYTIVEYEGNMPEDKDRPCYHVYVDEKDVNNGAETLEGALIIAIAKGTKMEINESTHMAKAACKLLGVE
jgi:hypothetical protein